MPIYNTNHNILRETIVSVLNQTFDDYEFLILNDSPENNSFRKIIISFNDTRIKYFENDYNIGISASRNKLIEMAQGEYLAICDHDDISLPTRFEEEVKFLDSHPNVGVVSALYEIFGDRNTKHKLWHAPEYDWKIKLFLSQGCYVAHPVAMIRKCVLQDNGIRYKETYSPAEDYKLWADLMECTDFYNIQKSLLKYRKYEKNTSIVRIDDMQNNGRKIAFEIKNKYPAYNEYFNSSLDKTIKIKLFGILTFLKIARNIVYLFGCIPLLKIKCHRVIR